MSFQGVFFPVAFIVTIGLKPYWAVEGEYLPHRGEILAAALPDATSQTEDCPFGNPQGHSQGEKPATETFPNGMGYLFVLSTAREKESMPL